MLSHVRCSAPNPQRAAAPRGLVIPSASQHKSVNAVEGPVGLDVALAKLPRRPGLAALLGWKIYLQSSKELLGTIREVVPQGHAGQAPGGGGMLLKACRRRVLAPYGFPGTEEHYVPLDASFVHAVHLKQRALFVKLPRGFLSLGRRSLLLGFLAQELPQFSLPLKSVDIGRSESRVMPTRQQLLAAGRRDLIDLVLQCGGFSEVATELGMRSKRRPAGYWDNLENLDKELRAFVAGQWVQLAAPGAGTDVSTGAGTGGGSGGVPGAGTGADSGASISGDTGSDTGGSSLPASAASYFYNLVSGRTTSRLPGGSVLGDIRRLARSEVAKDRVMPSRSMLTSVGRWDLHHAIISQGGYVEVGAALRRRPPSHGREAMISSEDELQEELRTFMKQQQEEQEALGQEQERQGQVLEDQPEHAQQQQQQLQVHVDGLQPVVEECVEASPAGSQPHEADAAAAMHGRLGGSKQDAPAQAIGRGMPKKQRLPTEQQLTNAGRIDLISVSLMHRLAEFGFGGYEHVARLSGLETHRRPRAYWKDIDNVVAEVQQFMESQRQQKRGGQQEKSGGQQEKSGSQQAVEQEEKSGSQQLPTDPSPGAGDHVDGGQGGATRAPAASVPERTQAQAAHDGSGACAGADARRTGGEGPARAGAAPRRQHLPTQRQLIAAGRQDLLYAVQLHGHGKVAKRCGLLLQQRGLHVRRLSHDLIRRALGSGHCRPVQIHSWLKEQCGVTVSYASLTTYLAAMTKAGLIVKLSRGVYASAAADPVAASPSAAVV